MMNQTDPFINALEYAARLHADQRRKGSGEPYLAHLLAVAALVMENGGTTTEAVAALLHDAVEDQGGQLAADDICRRFGPDVLAIVEGCSDAFVSPKPPWRERKESFIERLRSADASVRLIVAADKLHNVRSLTRLIRAAPHANADVWRDFRGGRDGTIWYYQAVLETLRKNDSRLIIEELAREISAFEKIA